MGATDFIGVEHIVLAILHDGESLPAQVVSRLGQTKAIVEEIDGILASDEYRGHS